MTLNKHKCQVLPPGMVAASRSLTNDWMEHEDGEMMLSSLVLIMNMGAEVRPYRRCRRADFPVPLREQEKPQFLSFHFTPAGTSGPPWLRSKRTRASHPGLGRGKAHGDRTGGLGRTLSL